MEELQENQDSPAVQEILADFRTKAPTPAAACATARALEKQGARGRALECLETVLATQPDHRQAVCQKARILMLQGDLSQALDTITPLASVGRDGDGVIAAQYADILGRLDRRDQAVQELRICLAQAPDNQRALFALIRVYQQKEEYAAARSVLDQALEYFPEVPWLLVQRVRLIRALQGVPAALEAARALAQDLPEHPDPNLMLAELQQESNQPGQVRETLSAVIKRFPDQRVAWTRLISLEYRERNYLTALEMVDRAREVLPSDPQLDIQRANCLAALGRHEEAMADFEAQVEQGQVTPQTFIKVIDLAMRLKDAEKTGHFARLGLRHFPDNQMLLENLAMRIAPGPGAVADVQLETRLAEKLPQAATTRLQLHRQIKSLDFAGALRALRQSQSHPPDARIAHQIALILFRAGRLKLAWRYLRACLRRWPDDRRFDDLFANVSGKAGCEAEALRVLASLGDSVLHAPLALLYCGTGATGAALEHYWKARNVGEIPSAAVANLLLRNLFADGRAEDVRRVTEDYYAACKPSQRHFRTSLVGQLMIEAEIELRQEEAAISCPLNPGDVPGHARLMQDFPRSNIAAMRYMRHWRHHVPVAAATVELAPRIIHQYWDEPVPPQSITDMLDSWRAAEGFEHRLSDRRQALDRLRRDFGPRWVEAFLMAGNASEEADFLRLCLLAMEGGVYADADDILIGRLTDLTDRGAGLVVYAEQGGGMVLGNNFIAARARHPAIMLAARMARQVLLSRSKDSTWFKTGPALFTRAVARYLASCVTRDEVADIVVLDQGDLTPTVQIHNRAPYRSQGRSWLPSQNTLMTDQIAAALREALMPQEIAAPDM